MGLAVAVDHLGAGVPFALVSHGEVDGVVPRLGIGDQVVRTLVALVRVWVLLVEIFVVLARKWWKVVL